MPPERQTPAPKPQPGQPQVQDPTAVFQLDQNKAAATCYLPVLPVAPNVLWIMTEPARNKELRFHAYQGLGIFVIAFVLSMAGNIIDMFSQIPVIGMVFGLISWLLKFVAMVAYFLVSGFLAYKAYEGEKIVLPYIGQFAEDKA
ncbi:MAG: hypothetical protein IPG59_19790 [Candidatus Melainabacteria bacterium]|nr:MAG: hypothetical protein IPG59_19790 [Candidatus Melainabacteria bacterium]